MSVQNALKILSVVFALSCTPVSYASAVTKGPGQQGEKRSDIKTVTGVVTESGSHETVIGATVKLKNTDIGTITDVNGRFSINVSGKKPVLVISSVGMKTKEVPVAQSGEISVELEPLTEMLEETVIVGSGVQKKVSVTGAISSINGDALAIPTSNLTTAFAGRIAGVIARQQSGEPGSGADFYIRGISTFGGRTTPLILLDEVEISAADLDYVPAENIKSFSILKDASATAIYGARGANGVMIVTTKTGEYNSKTKVNVAVENSFNFMDKFPKFVDGATYMRMYNEAAAARGRELRYTQEDIDNTAAHTNDLLYPDVNWKDVMFRNMSMRQKVNMNVTGGGSRVKYFMSLQASHDNGLLNTRKVYSWNNNINIMNYTFQNNIAYKLTPTTTIRMNMNAQIRQKKGPNKEAKDLFNNIMTTAPILFPVTFPAQEGINHILYGNDYITGNNTYPNPYAEMLTTFKERNENTLNTVVRMDQELDFITKGLKFNMWVNFKNWSCSHFDRSINPYFYRIKEGSWNPNNPAMPYELEPLNTNGSEYINQSDIEKESDQTFELQANLNWDQRFGKHSLGAMLIYKQREFRSSVLPNRNQGVSGRFTYDYDSRYLLEFNFGYNGTERLAKEDRFGFFPAASAGWIVSNEKFFEPLSKVLNHFKVRASYGLVGSDDLAKAGGSYFLYIDKITENKLDKLEWTSGQDLGYKLGGPELTYYAQKGLGWEKVKKFDVGVDITLLKDWQLTFDYFFDKRYDIFMNREAWPQSLAYDIAKPWSNIGRMQNQGVEFSLNYNHRFSSDLAVSLQGNFTYNQNKVTYKDEPIYPTVWQMEVNKPYGCIFGYIADGLFRSQEEIDNSPQQNLGSTPKVGDIKYRDISGDGKVDDADKTMISEFDGTPRIQYGFGGTIVWKKFDLGVFFTGSAMRKIMTNGMDPFQESIGVGNRNVVDYIANDYWTEEKQNWDAKYPRLGLKEADIRNNNQPSTYWMRDGSFMRLKNIELGYTIPYGRIYLSGVNLLTFSSFKLWDPELGGWNHYPMQKVVNIGLQLNI